MPARRPNVPVTVLLYVLVWVLLQFCFERLSSNATCLSCAGWCQSAGLLQAIFGASIQFSAQGRELQPLALLMSAAPEEMPDIASPRSDLFCSAWPVIYTSALITNKDIAGAFDAQNSETQRRDSMEGPSCVTQGGTE